MQSKIEATAKEMHRVFCEYPDVEAGDWKTMTDHEKHPWKQLAAWHLSFITEVKGRAFSG